MADNGDKRFQRILEGIQYLIGDNKHLREELLEFTRKADEDRRRADEDRRRSDDDRRRADERFDEALARSDERFAILLDQVKRTNRVAFEIARDIRGQQRQLLEGQSETNRLLRVLVKRRPNGHNGK